MNRRHFLKVSHTLGFAPLIVSRASTYAHTRADLRGQQPERIETIAGFTPEDLLHQYRHFLFDDFLPFMDKFVIDHERGGFLCNCDHKLPSLIKPLLMMSQLFLGILIRLEIH